MAADGTYRRYSYDSNGHMESSTAYDRNGKVTSTIRQQNGRWVALDPQGRDLGMGDVTKIDVDKEGNMRSTWRGGSETVNKGRWFDDHVQPQWSADKRRRCPSQRAYFLDTDRTVAWLLSATLSATIARSSCATKAICGTFTTIKEPRCRLPLSMK